MAQYKLLAVSSDAKTVKGESRGYLTGILYMTPADAGLDGRNLCPYATSGCRAACLYTAGRGIMAQVHRGRLRKRALFLMERSTFLRQLTQDIERLQRQARQRGMTPAVRLNGTTDLPWEAYGVMQAFPKVQFYDYTKSEVRYRRFLSGVQPINYHMTFSRSERNADAVSRFLVRGGTVAAVFAVRRSQPLPQYAEASDGRVYPVFDGDKSDLRFLDPPGHVIGVRAKGRATADRTGFVIRGLST